MRSTCIRTCLIAMAFGLSSVATAQTPAKEPNAVPAKVIQPRPAPQAAAPAEATPPVLRVGMPAPAFKVAKWFKGTPVEKLEVGNLYVVEFWATWCGPCRNTIPHLTELAHKHAGKITFIGVSVWERPKDKTDEGIFALVEPFVTEMGDKMDYNVAADGIDKAMATTWMMAADQRGIPCAFVIGRDGKIAWIGHPAAMDTVLDQVVAGTWDVQAEAKRQEIEWRNRQKRLALEAPINAALKAKDNKAVLDAVEKAVAALPEMEQDLMPVKFRALLQVDEAAGFAYLRTLLENGSIEKNPYNAFNAAMIVGQQAATLKSPDYVLVIAALEKAKAGEQENPNVLVLYADMLFKAGRIDDAVQMQEKAIEKAKPFVGTRLPQAWLDKQQVSLEEYKAKRPQGAQGSNK
ncbi:MAG: TlpA family protein disulfide reductase [Phycisphaerae bacterium]|nr:TlpA family protein disulfide reductase [Phycisphaerae bacterium]